MYQVPCKYKTNSKTDNIYKREIISMFDFIKPLNPVRHDDETVNYNESPCMKFRL